MAEEEPPVIDLGPEPIFIQLSPAVDAPVATPSPDGEPPVIDLGPEPFVIGLSPVEDVPVTSPPSVDTPPEGPDLSEDDQRAILDRVTAEVLGGATATEHIDQQVVTGATTPDTAPPSTDSPPEAADPVTGAVTGDVPLEDPQSVIDRTLDATITPDLLADATGQSAIDQTQQSTAIAVDRMITSGTSSVGVSPTGDTLATTDATATDIAASRNITDGASVAEEAAQAQDESEDALARQVGSGTDDGTSPVLFDSQDAGFGPLPHRFREKNYQVMHHEALVYIQGVEVSNWIEGAITITYNLNSEPNSCDITLNNAFNRWVLTPENMNGQWRIGNSSHEVADYDESPKKAIFDIKNPIGNNPVDPLSGGRMWPIDYWSPIFHKMDPIRVWIRNPLAPEFDEFLPMFTGYVIGVNVKGGYIKHDSTVTLSCKDIRYLMSKMRTNTNSILWVQPGNELSENANQLSQGVSGSDVGGGAFSSDFFEDLVVRNSFFENPWANMNLFQVISSLTYDDFNPTTTITENLDRNIESLQREISDLQAALAALPADNPALADRRARIQQEIASRQSRLSRAQNPPAAPTNAAASGETGTAPATSGAQAPAGQTSPQSSATTTAEPAQPRGRGRIGRMSRGKIYAYPHTEDLARVTDTPSTDTATMTDDQLIEAGSRAMTNWTDIIVFGYPTRQNLDPQGLDAQIIADTTTCKYWTLAQVQEAGRLTRSNRAWAPDVQLVHILKPMGISSGDAVIQDNTYLTNSGVNVQYNWTTRLDLLNEACDAVDYRFYVTGSGDLVFEFPQYDFNPNDYNLLETTSNYGWQPVYEFDRDLLNDGYDPEAGEIVTSVIVVGGLTGFSQFADVGGGDNGARALAPEAMPHAICYSPLLTGRHGVNIKEKTLPLITNRGHLAQIAAMEFQKALALASSYTMDVAYRPWVTLNRPVFNKFHNRYAVTDSVTHVIPLRESAGEPQTTLSLSYPRNLDQFGVPRFLTGGASLPVFFGKIPDRSRELQTVRDNLASRSSEFTRLLQATETHSITQADVLSYQGRYNAPFPESYDFYNIVLLASAQYTNSTAAEVGSAVTELLGRAQDIQRQIIEVQGNSRLSINERARRTEELRRQLEQITTDIAAARSQAAVLDPSSPLFGASGVRTPDDDAQPDPGPGDSAPVLCELDPYNWSSPLGRNPNNAQEWPRRIVRSFSEVTHQGVDYLATSGEKVYAIGDGHVIQVSTHPYYGSFVKVQHADFFSVYAPLQASVSVGTGVRRNQELGTVSSSPESSEVGYPILHLSFGSTRPPDQVRRPFFDPPTVYPLAPRVLRSGVALKRSFAQNRAGQRGASATRVHGGYDLGCEAGHQVVAATGGRVHRVYTNQSHGSPPANREGHGITIVDRYGAKHGYFHFRDPVDQTRYVEGATVNPGDVLGVAGRTGSATGVHLHYQIEVPGGGTDRLRVDVGPRLAALYLGLPVVPVIAKCEASLWGKESGVQHPPRALPESAPESPVEGLTVDQIWRQVGASGGSAVDSSSIPLLPGAQFFDTAVISTEPTAVPFLVPPGSITNSDQLTFAIIGDLYATHRSQFRQQLENSLHTVLDRNISLRSYGVTRSSISQWLETPTEANARRTVSLRNAHTDTLRDAASEANFILVSITGTEATASDMTPERIQQVDSILRSQGAFVLWIIHKPQPLRTRSLFVQPGQRSSTIQDLLTNGITLEQADVHVASGSRIRAAGVRFIDSGLDRIDRIARNAGWSPNGDYTRTGARAVAPGLAQSAVSQLRELARDAAITTSDSNDWLAAVPPEECPPGNQMRLHGDGVTPPPIPGAPTVTPVPETGAATTVADQAEQDSADRRRRGRTRHRGR